MLIANLFTIFSVIFHILAVVDIGAKQQNHHLSQRSCSHF